MKVSFALFALAAVLVPVAASASVEEPLPAQDQEPQQHLRRANVFNNNNSNVVDIIVVLKEEGRRRKLNGQATAAERKADAEANKAAASATAESMGAIARLTYGSAIYGFATSVPPGLLKKIEADSRVAYVEIDAIVQLDPMEMGEDRRQLAPPAGKGPNKDDNNDGPPPPQETPWGITRVRGGGSSSFATAWVIDSGIDLTHEDLNVDVARSKAFGKMSSPDDQNGHGTHVAGTIAAIDNDRGVIGVAPGAPVVSVRVLDRRGSGSYSGVIDGVDYVAANCAANDVANMSLGGGYSTAMNNAVIRASESCRFVLAAGNDGKNAVNYSPASANGPKIYTVSAFGSSSDNWAYWSNYGSPVDYAAPGVGVLSTYKDGGYRTLSGTSMAAPHIAGVILVNAGEPVSDGTVNGDPDSKKDPIGVCS